MHPYLGPTEKTPCETIGRPSSAITGSIKKDDGRFLENPSYGSAMFIRLSHEVSTVVVDSIIAS